jgi:hypothetical protein
MAMTPHCPHFACMVLFAIMSLKITIIVKTLPWSLLKYDLSGEWGAWL